MADPRAIVAVGLATSVAALAWYATLTIEPITGPSRMVWHRADGSPAVEADPDYSNGGCTGDIGLEIAAWHGGALVSCDSAAIGIGWAFLDPAAGEARLRWPAERNQFTVGLIPGPHGELAIVFEPHLSTDLAFGIATIDGWRRPPESLGKVTYRAAAWIGDDLQLVVTPSTTSDSMPAHTIVTIHGNARTDRTGIASCGTDCFASQIVYRAHDHWVFEGYAGSVTETGEPATPIFDDNLFPSMIELLAAGRLDSPPTLSLGMPTPALVAGGTVTTVVPPVDRVPISQIRYAIEGSTIARQPLWKLDERLRFLVERVQGRDLARLYDDEGRVRVADHVEPEAVAPLHPIAHWDQGLEKRILLPDDRDGYWFVDSSGEYLHLDHALHRLDPRSLREHLTERGSLGPHIQEPTHVYVLGWALLGWPILLLGAVVAGRGKPRTKHVLVVAAVYLVTGGYALWVSAALLLA